MKGLQRLHIGLTFLVLAHLSDSLLPKAAAVLGAVIYLVWFTISREDDE